MIRASLVVLVAGYASAQPDMLITVDNVSGADWRISAEFLTVPPNPIDGIGAQIWLDTSFDLTGDGEPISITGYNPAYDTALGDAQITNGPTASFVGNANPFFGTTDSSNPLFVIDFEYAGSFEAITLTLVGKNSANFVHPPLGDVRLYQDAGGNPGELTWDVRYIPAPATLALAPFALVATCRRRK